MTESRASGISRLQLLLLTALIYLAVIYGLTPGNAPVFHPIHHDDYAALAAVPVLRATRPLYYLTVGLISYGGIPAFYGLLHLLTALVSGQVLWLLMQSFQLRQPLLPVVVTAALTFANANFVDAGRYNLLTNLLAGFFALAALLQYRRYVAEGGHSRLLLATAALGLSLLAKEDFVLPVLVLGAAALLQQPQLRRARFAFAAALTTAVLMLGSARLIVGSRFLAGSSDPTAPYFINLAPASLLTTYAGYLSFSGATLLQNWWLLALIGFSVVVQRRLVQPWLLLAGLTLPLPYALLPNHVYTYYAINWAAWLNGYAVFAAAAALETLTVSRLQRAGRMALLLSAVLLPALATPQRTIVAERYVDESRRQTRITATLTSYRDELQAWPVVGLRGLPLFNPWFYDDAAWPVRQGYANHWVLEADPTAWYFPFYEPWIAAELPDARVRYISSAERDAYGGLPWLEFDQDGNGRLVLTAELRLAAATLLDLMAAFDPAQLPDHAPVDTPDGRGVFRMTGDDGAEQLVLLSGFAYRYTLPALPDGARLQLESAAWLPIGDGARLRISLSDGRQVLQEWMLTPPVGAVPQWQTLELPLDAAPAGLLLTLAVDSPGGDQQGDWIAVRHAVVLRPLPE